MGVAEANETVGDVRATAFHSLLRLLEAGHLDSNLECFREHALSAQYHDHDRYVTAYAAEAVHRVDHRLALRLDGDDVAAIQAPALIRWCTHGDGWGASSSKGDDRARTHKKW